MHRYSKLPAPVSELLANAERIERVMRRENIPGRLAAVSQYDTEFCAVEENGRLVAHNFFDKGWRRGAKLIGYSEAPTLIKIEDIEGQTTLF